jgi:DNA-binding GntR family transcriptional regulator
LEYVIQHSVEGSVRTRRATLPGGLPRPKVKDKSKIYEQIFAAIKYGFDGARKEPGEHILSSTIEMRLGIPGTLVREAVHFLRTHGRAEIGADSRGYYVAENMAAFDADMHQLISRRDALNELIAAKQARRVEFAEMLGKTRGRTAREVEEARGAHAVPPSEWQKWNETHGPKAEGEKQGTFFGGEA